MSHAKVCVKFMKKFMSGFIFLSALYCQKVSFVKIKGLKDDYIDYSVHGP